MMRRVLAIIVMVGAAGAISAMHEVKRHLSGKFLDTMLHPDKVASALSVVIDEWKDQAAKFAQSQSNDSMKAFEQSCSSVAISIMTGSSGNRGDVTDYMRDICQQEVANGISWRDACFLFKTSMEAAMVEASFDAPKACSGFWTKFVEKERIRLYKKATERTEAEKNAAEKRAEEKKNISRLRAEAEEITLEQMTKREAKVLLRESEKKDAAGIWRAKESTKHNEIVLAANKNLKEAAASEKKNHRLLLKKIKADMFSTHEVRGASQRTTYRFQNVCYDLQADDKTLLYYTSGSSTSPPTQMQVSIVPPIFIGPKKIVETVGIRSVAGPIPEQAEFLKTPVAVLINPFYPKNFGHQVVDNMFVYWELMHTFGVVDYLDTQLLYAKACPEPNGELCRALYAKLYPALSRNPVLEFKASELMKAPGNLSSKQNHHGLMCFKTLLSGCQMDNYFWTWKNMSSISEFHIDVNRYWLYRSFILQSMLGNHPMPSVPPGVEHMMHDIGILTKPSWQRWSGAGIGNAPELQMHLSSRFPAYNVQHYDPAAMSFREQLEKVSQSVVLFSHAGGGSFISIFLQKGATLAIMDVFQQELNFYNNLWFNVRSLHVSLAERRDRDIPMHVNVIVAENIVHEALHF